MVIFGKPHDTAVHQEEPFNAEPPRTALCGSSITPVDRFYVRNHGAVAAPSARPLTVDGLVDRALELSPEQLRENFPRRTLTATLPGRHAIVVRAWDSAGAIQPEHAASVWNPKGYVNTRGGGSASM